ncbi:hypothetical protein AwMethylo_36300 [Methylobacterium sp.]|nr:hypothetical protein AwMethylo_36300 [Methylobacterium sp.]
MSAVNQVSGTEASKNRRPASRAQGLRDVGTGGGAQGFRDIGKVSGGAGIVTIAARGVAVQRGLAAG